MTEPYYADDAVTLYRGDALAVLRELPANSVNCAVTSPPYYGLRDYGEPGQYGLEETPAEYVATLRAVFADLRRVLTVDGTLWLNLGDAYARSSKNLLGTPWRVAFALQDDGWILRNHIVWHKLSTRPESVKDRLSSRHESLFLLTKSDRYWFDLDAIREPHSAATVARLASGPVGVRRVTPGEQRDPHVVDGLEKGRNPGDVWSIPSVPFTEAHFAVMPPALAKRCILAGCRPGGVVLDPFCGSGTTGLVAGRLGLRFVGIDLSAKYLDLALRTRLAQSALIGEVAS